MTLLALLFVLLLVPLTLLLVVPLGVLLAHGPTLLTLPGQLLAVARDARRRRNLALEHATIHLLERRLGARLPVGGFAAPDGFVVQGPVAPEQVLAAAREGLERLQAGEGALARHPRSAATVVAGQMIALPTFVGMLLLMEGGLSFFALLLALGVALLAARWGATPLSLLLQRPLSRADLSGLSVDRLDAHLPDSPLALMLSGGMPTRFRVWTHDVQVESLQPKRWRAY